MSYTYYLLIYFISRLFYTNSIQFNPIQKFLSSVLEKCGLFMGYRHWYLQTQAIKYNLFRLKNLQIINTAVVFLNYAANIKDVFSQAATRASVGGVVGCVGSCVFGAVCEGNFGTGTTVAGVRGFVDGEGLVVFGVSVVVDAEASPISLIAINTADKVSDVLMGGECFVVLRWLKVLFVLL